MNNVRSRAFQFTWSNYPDSHQDRLDALDPRYVCYGYEWAPTTGTPHLQGYLYFDHQRRLAAVRRHLQGVHVECAQGTYTENRIYCSKDGEFVEFGVPPQTPQEIGQAEKDRYEEAWRLAQRGEFALIEPELRLRHYSTLKIIARDYMVRPPQLGGPCGIWIHGPAGCGKTTSANRKYPDAFLKPINKWWDGYQGEETVICDDFGIYHRELTTSLKHWADFLPFVAETKGSSTYVRPKRFIVTSQYTIEKIWENDEEALAALRRRFTVIEKIQGQDIML